MILISGQKLVKGGSLYSQKRTCKLTLREDGDLVMRKLCGASDIGEVWSVRRGPGRTINFNCNNGTVDELVMKEDGRLTVENHASGSLQHPWIDSGPNADGADLRLRDGDCRMCVFKDGSCRWTAHAAMYDCSTDGNPG